MTKDFACGYISALIDGEGWVAEQSTHRGRNLYRVTIANTDVGIINKAKVALGALGIGPSNYYVNAAKRPGRKEIFHLIISNRFGLERLEECVVLGSERKRHALKAQIALYAQS